MKSSYLELNLPEYLSNSISIFKDGLKKSESDSSYLHFDCDYCQLQANINCAESDNEISSEQAWYLREKYLGITKDSIEGAYA